MKAREGEGVFASTPGTCRFLENKKPSTLTSKVLGSGDVLLSRGLSPYYHRGCSVSLPCSEWERVVPLRYCHQSAEPHWHFAAIAARQADIGLWGLGRLSHSPLPKFRKNMIFNPHSAIENPQFGRFSDIYI